MDTESSVKGARMNMDSKSLEKKTISFASIGAFSKQYLIIIAIILLAIYAAIVEPEFLTGSNFENIIRQFGVLSMTSIGMTFVILGGYVDLSIPGIMALVSMVSATLIPVVGEVPALLIGLVLGALCGFLDSIILRIAGAKNDADAVFITFGMSMLYLGLANLYHSSTYHLPDTVLFSYIGKGKILGLPVYFFIFLVALIISHLFLSKTQTGREIRLTGANRDAARLAGISSSKSTMIIYSLLGLFAALGAIIAFSRVTTAAPINGKNFETNSILAVVIGGMRFRSGIGSVLRTAMGVLLVTVMSNALNLIGVPVDSQDLVRGLIFIIAIWLDNRRKD